MEMPSTADAFLKPIDVNLEKGRGGRPLAEQKEAKRNEGLAYILKRNEALSAEALNLWEARLRADPLLADVPQNALLDDIEALLARELGTGVAILLVRMDGERVPLQLTAASTVRDLKLRIKAVLSARYEQEALMGRRKISWKSVWADFCLTFNGQRLLDESAKLIDLGVVSNAEVLFARYNAQKAIKDARPRREKRLRRGDQ